jgi:hypothetical protein
MLNLGQGVAWDGLYGRGVRTNKPEDYLEYVRAGDFVSFDIYPVVHESPEVVGKLWYVGLGTQPGVSPRLGLAQRRTPNYTYWRECGFLSG